jgi:hypothetical protein
MRAALLCCLSLGSACGDDSAAGSVDAPIRSDAPRDGTTVPDAPAGCVSIEKIPGIDADIAPLGLALDGSGHAHIAWTISGTGGGIGYTTNRTGSWVLETVAAIGTWPSLALDAQGHAHIVYTEGGRTNGYTDVVIRYATNASGSWVTTTVDDSAAYFARIALDAAGALHVAYSDRVFVAGTGTVIRGAHATGGGASWTSEPIESELYNASVHGFLFDSAGKPHVIYRQPGSPRHAWEDAGTWMHETLPLDHDHVSATIDAADHLHLAYGASAVYYATNATGAWTSETLAMPSSGDDPSIGILAGEPVMSVFDQTSSHLYYVAHADGAWSALDPFGAVGGENNALVVGADGVVNVAYASIYYARIACSAAGSER